MLKQKYIKLSGPALEWRQAIREASADLLRDGIRFEDGDTVYLLFFFSQKGDTDYLDLFKEIIKLGKDPEQISRFRQLSDAAAVRRLMEEVLSAD